MVMKIIFIYSYMFSRMNLFLGIFIPQRNKPALWDRDAPHEPYLHMPELCDLRLADEERRSTQLRWWDKSLRGTLPYSLSEKRKQCLAIANYNPNADQFDHYKDHYMLDQFTRLSEMFQFKEVSHSVRDYMPYNETDYR